MTKYSVGDVMHHKRYGYRGVIASIDPFCRASDRWYERNQTQPKRAQPWYHVLVEGGRETYVAEENLEPDASGHKVDHPFIHQYFAVHLGGRYHRTCPN